MKIRILIVLLLLSVAVLSACATPLIQGDAIAPGTGQVIALRLNSTLHGMKQASIGAAGTKVFQKGDLLTFIWTLRDGWAFATINVSTRQPIQHFANVFFYNLGILIVLQTYQSTIFSFNFTHCLSASSAACIAAWLQSSISSVASYSRSNSSNQLLITSLRSLP